MPKMNYQDYTRTFDPYGQSTVWFLTAGNSLKERFQEVLSDMNAWAGSDETKKGQIQPLREKIESLNSAFNNLCSNRLNPVDSVTFGKYIGNFDALQEVLSSECWPGGETVMRRMVNNYKKLYPRSSTADSEKTLKSTVGNLSQFIFQDIDAVDFEQILKTDADLAEKAKQRQQEEAERQKQQAFEDEIAAAQNDPAHLREWLQDKANASKKNLWLRQHFEDYNIGRFHYYGPDKQQLSDEDIASFVQREIDERAMNVDGKLDMDGLRNLPLTSFMDSLNSWAEDMRKPNSKWSDDPAEADFISKFADAIKQIQSGVGQGHKNNIYEDVFTEGWETLTNEILPRFSEKKGDKTYFQWLYDKLVERGAFPPARLNTILDILVNDYKIPLSPEFRETSTVYERMGGKMLKSFRENGDEAKSLNQLIESLQKKSDELTALGGQRKPSEITLFNRINNFLPHAKLLQKVLTDPQMKNKAFRDGEGKSIATAAVRRFNSELSSVEDQLPSETFKKYFGAFHEKWRDMKYHIRRDNMSDKSVSWKNYLNLHTGENADGREEEYLAKACVAATHLAENPPKKFSLKGARKEAAAMMKDPRYQALALDKKAVKYLLRNRRFDLVPQYLNDPYSYGADPAKLKTALRSIVMITKDFGGGNTDEEKAFSASFEKVRNLTEENINNMETKEAAGLLQEVSKGTINFVNSKKGDFKTADGREFTGAALDVAKVLGKTSAYGKAIMSGMMKEAGAQYKAAGLGKLESNLYGMKGREQRKKNDDALRQEEFRKAEEAVQKQLREIRKLAGKNPKAVYQVKEEDIGNLPKLPDNVEKTQVGYTEGSLRDYFSSNDYYFNAGNLIKALRLSTLTAFNDNGTLVVSNLEYTKAVKSLDGVGLYTYYKDHPDAQRNVAKLAKQGGDYLAAIKNDFAEMKRQAAEKQKQAEAGNDGPQAGV